MPQYCMRVFMIIVLCLILAFSIFLVRPLVPTLASGACGTTTITAGDEVFSIPSRCRGWNIIPGPTSSASSIYTFLATAAVSSSDIWAVGLAANASPDHANMPLTAHWDGSSWNVINTPNNGAENALQAVTAISSNDVWAVGGVEGMAPLIEHWDGGSWSLVPGPTASATFYDIAQVPNSHQLWAVGDRDGTQPFIENWNGSSWSIVPTPALGFYSSLWGVTALAEDNAWAVGTYKSTFNSLTKTLIEHWNGSSWGIVPSPNLDQAGWLKKVVAVPGSSQLWAVGNAITGSSTGHEETLIEHWDGFSWSVISSPNQTPADNLTTNTLTGVAALSPDNVWAVGFYQRVGGSAAAPGQSLMEHWNGTSWTMASSPNLYEHSILYGITRIPNARELLAIGRGTLNNMHLSYVEVYRSEKRDDTHRNIGRGASGL